MATKSESLHEVARAGDVVKLQQLLASGNSIDSRDRHSRTPVHMAAWAGQADTLRALLSAGANYGLGAMDDMNALHFAAQNGHVQTTELLLDTGLRVESRNRKGLTALHIAAQRGHPELVRYLLKRRASPRAKNKRGLTPLDVAKTSEIRQLLEDAVPEGPSGKPAEDSGAEQQSKATRPNARKRGHDMPAEPVEEGGEGGNTNADQPAPKAAKQAKVPLAHLGDEEEDTGG